MTAVKQQRTIDLDPNRLMRILHIDDKQAVLNLTKDVLEAKSYSVELVLSPIDAIKKITLEKKRFEVLIVDILFEQSENIISGIEFVSKSKPFLKDITVIAYTGHQDKIRKEHLPLFNGGVFLKGTEDEDLFDKIDQLYNDKVKRIEEEIYETHYNGNEHQLDLYNADYKRHQERLIQELESVEGDEVLAVTGDGAITARELIEEIKKGTEFGKRHVNSLLNHLDTKREEKNGKK